MYQLFEDLRTRSKLFCGIDRDVFVKFCPLPGLWGHRVFKIIKYYSVDEYINFDEFIQASRYLCRSTDAELDEIIFKIFDLTDSKFITEEELMMMLINLPDMGFSSSNNIY